MRNFLFTGITVIKYYLQSVGAFGQTLDGSLDVKGANTSGDPTGIETLSQDESALFLGEAEG